jgi:hypothetical protein
MAEFYRFLCFLFFADISYDLFFDRIVVVACSNDAEHKIDSTMAINRLLVSKFKNKE